MPAILSTDGCETGSAAVPRCRFRGVSRESLCCRTSLENCVGVQSEPRWLFFTFVPNLTENCVGNGAKKPTPQWAILSHLITVCVTDGRHCLVRLESDAHCSLALAALLSRRRPWPRACLAHNRRAAWARKPGHPRRAVLREQVQADPSIAPNHPPKEASARAAAILGAAVLVHRVLCRAVHQISGHGLDLFAHLAEVARKVRHGRNLLDHHHRGPLGGDVSQSRRPQPPDLVQLVL